MAILLIDDDAELCELISAYLRREGFCVVVMHRFRASTWNDMREGVDIVILDIGLPGLNGLQVLQWLRSQSMVPVLMLTARGDDVDRIAGLELGADDYLSKPCNPRELVARIRAVLRRAVPSVVAGRMGVISVNGLALDAAARQVTLDGKQVLLTSTEFSVLERLMRDAGQAIAKDVLVRDALGRRAQPYERAIDMHISGIRRKIGEHRVQTVRGFGYLLVRHG